MIGLTGDMEAVKRVSKQYRVYFSKTGENNNDYLVDHSIIHYLINPAGGIDGCTAGHMLGWGVWLSCTFRSCRLRANDMTF